MAVTRKKLKGMGLTDEQVEAVIEDHLETVNGLQAQIDTYKADAEKLPGVQKELDELKAADGGYKAKYEKEHSDFDQYKKDVAAKETAATTERLFRAELTALGITGKRADAIIRATDLSTIKVKDGALEDAKSVQKSIKDDWAEFIPTTHTVGANTPTPPGNMGGRLTKADIYKKDDKGRYVMDATERQNALAKMLSEEQM